MKFSFFTTKNLCVLHGQVFVMCACMCVCLVSVFFVEVVVLLFFFYLFYFSISIYSKNSIKRPHSNKLPSPFLDAKNDHFICEFWNSRNL